MEQFIVAANGAGPNLTADSFVKSMERVKIPTDMFGTPEVSFGPNKRVPFYESRLSQIQGGRWKVISEYVK